MIGIITDETRDISGVKQFSLSLRWVDSEIIVNEDLIEFASVEQTDAATLTNTLRDSLIRCNLLLAQCRGKAYGAASNMSGLSMEQGCTGSEIL